MVDRAQHRSTVGSPKVHVHCDYVISQETRGGADGGMGWGGFREDRRRIANKLCVLACVFGILEVIDKDPKAQ